MSDPGAAPANDGLTRDCVDPWTYVEIRPNGDVGLCCFRPGVGNIVEADIACVLRGDSARRLRRALLAGTLDSFCGSCRARALVPCAALQERVAKLYARVALPADFDAGAYLDANPEVTSTNLEPEDHFLRVGRLSGRPLGSARAPEERQGWLTRRVRALLAR